MIQTIIILGVLITIIVVTIVRGLRKPKSTTSKPIDGGEVIGPNPIEPVDVIE
jgi:hypothetical protein